MQRLRHGAAAALCTVALAVPTFAGERIPASTGVVASAHVVAPQRIVSLLPSATEAVCALGACALLVGVDTFSQDPPEVQQLQRLGRTFQPDIEGIVRLQPDLVLMGNVPAARQRLQAAGLRVEVVEATTVEQVHTMLQRIDSMLHPTGSGQAAQAPQLWARLQSDLQRVTAASRQQMEHRPQRVYLEVDGALYAAGPRSYIGQMLSALGAENIVPDNGKPFPQLSPEWVLRADPDLIIQTFYAGQQDLAKRPGWSHMRAVQEGHVCRLSEHDSRTVSRPGPRLATAAEVLARCLQRGAHSAITAAHTVDPTP